MQHDLWRYIDEDCPDDISVKDVTDVLVS